MKVLALIISTIIQTTILGQHKQDSTLTTSIIATGITSEEINVGRYYDSYCLVNVDKTLKAGTTVIISGAIKCETKETKKTSNIYELIYENEIFYVNENFIKTRFDYFTQLIAMPKAKADSFKTNALKRGNELALVKKNEALNFIKKCAAKGVVVLNWAFYDESEYTDGTSVSILVLNPTKKTIKYIWFTFVGYNPVGDKVIDIKRGATPTVRGIGPIRPNEKGGYEFSYVWFSDLVEAAKLVSIKIQYMDGTIKQVNNAKEVILSKEYYDRLYNNE